MASQLSSRIRQAPSTGALAALESALASFRIASASPPHIGRRHASHQAQGRANGAKDGPGKRLGAKKTGGEYVVPGNILFKQRGTHWFPGDNTHMGRDHTIHASQAGYVTYYRDPEKHPKRKYIGIVFERNQTLPQAPNEVRRRKLGMLAYRKPPTESEIQDGELQFMSSPDAEDSASKPATIIRDQPNESRDITIVRGKGKDKHEVKLHFRTGYMYRQANWEIGRAAERSKAAMAVRPFKPGDRFAAWRKRTARRIRSAEKRALGRGKGKKK
ncbi:54S ribosomal protein L2, mitochondrial [Pseudocercospora fuligena]|uniref:Large ribosomal subunit protein bL27m n=1 Tax=Pseudocercospora fuligena TaxID=685502 RepID=A0A8H6RHY7_9PEZI|nr:54S ribosomal protein L2, mitochondrial [Pseudocercospora fuligena]